MIDAENAARVISALIKNLDGVARNPENFQRLPDSFWGYYARGHDAKGAFGVIVTYSEDESNVDDLIGMYEKWVQKNKSREPDKV